MSTIAERTTAVVAQEPREMPPELVEELAELLAQALLADLRQHPNLAELKAKEQATVVSPTGIDRAECRPDGRGPDHRPRKRASARRLPVAPAAARDGPVKGPQ